MFILRYNKKTKNSIFSLQFSLLTIATNYIINQSIALEKDERHRASQTSTDDKVSTFYRMDSESADVYIPCDTNALSQPS